MRQRIRQPTDIIAGFTEWHLAVIGLASLVSVLAVLPVAPLTGGIGLLIALIGWASTVRLLQIGNAILVGRFSQRLPGLMNLQLYATAAILGLIGIVVELWLRSPSPWELLAGRFTPEIAAFGLFVVGAFFALVLASAALAYHVVQEMRESDELGSSR